MGQFAVKQPPITLLQGKKLSAILDLAFLEWPKFVADVKVWADWLFFAFFAGELLYSGKWQRASKHGATHFVVVDDGVID